MTALTAPAVQVCVFALGCALIHATRAHAAAVTRLLTGAAAVAAAGVLIAASVYVAPEDVGRFDEITVFAALSGQGPLTPGRLSAR